ncbi:tyrosine-type recombinase/integrase [Lysinibacillus sp. CNPSo 3705]|uniref:tyrosine-type recombinase/integrase n=1 Tax=Lysinibacillus sp. CNPSo 3705 TaxID=3028148 RepID=UPI0023634DBA|nr:tyrosine-type recombinase/integrase [Lysinibacillus sp. CNPSo 3705]MDD1505303.1 tyrosine-type recombinase/integrase [Lysinibacillus sp. CNPSo 3705]
MILQNYESSALPSTASFNFNYDQQHMEYLLTLTEQSEANQMPRFEEFTDRDMVLWYLYHSKQLFNNRGRSKRSTLKYKAEIEQFLEFLLLYSEEIGVDISEIKDHSLFKSLQPRHIRRYQEWLATNSPYVKKKKAQNKDGYSIATLERKTTILKGFFKQLFECKYINEPLHEGFKSVNVTSNDRPNRDMGPFEVVEFLRYFEEKNNPIMFTLILVLVTTGMRNEELCTLKIEHMRKDTIKGGYYLDVLGKGGKWRRIPLKAKVAASIMEFRKIRGLVPIETAEKDSPLFTTKTGNAYSPSYLDQVFNREFSKIESNKAITPHIFRHAFAIISHINGADIYKIMKSLGHEKIETTIIYMEKVLATDQHAIHEWEAANFEGYI